MARETIESRMPGTIISVKAKVGDSIKEYDAICILKSMKIGKSYC